MTFHPQVPCFRRRFPWKPGRLPGSSGTARRPGSPTVEHVELRAAGAREHLGRSRAVIRDVARIFDCLTSRARAALNSGTHWGAILPSRGKFWRFPSMARLIRISGVYRDALYYVTDDGEWRHDVIFLHTSKRVATELSAVAVQKFEAGAVLIREGCRLASVLADAILTGVLKGPNRSPRSTPSCSAVVWGALAFEAEGSRHGTPPACACPSGGDPTGHHHA